MKQVLNKKSFAIMVLSVLLVASFLQLSVYAVEMTADVDTEKVLEFLKNVVQVDTAKYEARLSTVATNRWPWLGGIAQTTGQYTLDSTGLGGTSILTVTFTFWDNELISCSYYEIAQGPTLYSQKPDSDLSNAASSFLQRYHTYTNDPQITQMNSLLDTVQVSSNNTKTVGSLQLAVLVEDNKTLLTWSNIVNGADYSRLRLEFKKGQFSEFSDDRKFYKLVSSDINISEDQAVSIALERAANYSYVYNGEEITGFDVVKEQIRSQPAVLNKTKPMELYPCWIVDLPLRTIYPGSVSYIEVMIWADTGEVISCNALGYGFPGESPYPTPTLSAENNQVTNTDGVPLAVYISGACIAIVIPIAIAVITLKRRSK